jgi:4-amino-4-deoxy-L-arabinose transferase-like glycosyltransferase
MAKGSRAIDASSRGALVVVAAAILLRFWHLSAAGISHWDAGTYTAGVLGVGPYSRGESVLFQTPPLVPALFRALFAIAGPSDLLAMSAVAAIGAATVWLLWRAGRSWIGETPALLGAAALASMEFHLLFSRQALTDVPFAFFVLLAVFAFTAAVERGSFALAIAAGAATGAALLTKYHGLLALAIAAAWLAGRMLFRRAPADPKRSATLWLAALGVALLPLAWLVLHVRSELGLDAFLESRKTWMQAPGLYLGPLAARFLARSFLEWVSPFVLAPALVGFAILLVRRSAGDLVLLAWTVVFLAALPFYRLYPRLLVPLCLPLALAAGVGLDAIARALASRWERGRAAALLAIALVPGAWSARASLSVGDRGYERAAEFLRAAPADPRPDVLVAQHAILFYLRDDPHPYLCHEEEGAIETLEAGRFRYLVADLRLEHAPRFRKYLETHDFELVADLPNPLPSSTIVNSAGFEGLDGLRSGALSAEQRAILERIRIWRRRQ